MSSLTCLKKVQGVILFLCHTLTTRCSDSLFTCFIKICLASKVKWPHNRQWHMVLERMHLRWFTSSFHWHKPNSSPPLLFCFWRHSKQTKVTIIAEDAGLKRVFFIGVPVAFISELPIMYWYHPAWRIWRCLPPMSTFAMSKIRYTVTFNYNRYSTPKTWKERTRTETGNRFLFEEA